MIGSLRGVVLDRRAPGELLLEVQGIGYRVHVPTPALVQFELGAQGFCFVHHHVREDADTLYGFPTVDERDTFETLITISGVGPKLALAMLSVHAPTALRRACAERDLDALCLVPGVGKRTAQRLLVELEAKLGVYEVDLVAVTAGGPAVHSARTEVRDALAGLGYGTDEIRAVVALLPEDGTVEVLLRDALRRLATGG